MFDTIHFKERRRLTVTRHDDWDIQHIDWSEKQRTNRPCLIATHRRLHIRMTGVRPDEFDKVQIPSLPALLYGHNAIELRGWQDLNTAMFVADEIISQISELKFQSTRIFTRVDIGWNLALDYDQLVANHHKASQPLARREAFLNREKVLELPCSGQRLIFYPKVAQMKEKLMKKRLFKNFKACGPFTRAEVQLEGKKLKLWLGEGDHVTVLDLYRAYLAFRGILCSISMPIGKTSTIADSKLSPQMKLLCKLAIEDHPFFGEYLRDLSPSQRKTKKAAVKRSKMKFIPTAFAWDNFLPSDNPPDPVQLHGIEELRPEYPDIVRKCRMQVANDEWHPSVRKEDSAGETRQMHSCLPRPSVFDGENPRAEAEPTAKMKLAG